jgi:hypothetical protein
VHLAPREEGVVSGLGQLQPYIIATADELSTALEQRAISDLNDWLVSLASDLIGLSASDLTGLGAQIRLCCCGLSPGAGRERSPCVRRAGDDGGSHHRPKGGAVRRAGF